MRTKSEIPLTKSSKKFKHYIALDTTFAAKTALYLRVKELKLTKINLAKMLKCDEKEVRRLLDPHSPSKFVRVEEALHKLGKRITLQIVPMD